MRISDWSSDVCSSDLGQRAPCQYVRLRKARDDKCVECLIYPPHRALTMKFGPRRILPLLIALFTVLSATWIMAGGRNAEGFRDRKSVVSGKRGSVRVDLGGRGIIKKKKKKDN